MDYTIALPNLIYGEHENIRKEYKYSDDLVNPYNWGNEMSIFEPRINKYLDERDRFSDIRSRSLRKIGIPMEETSRSMDVFQTLSGDILNNYVFIKIGKTISSQYEHYVKQSGEPIPVGSLRTNYLDVEKLPNDIADDLIEMSSLANNLSSKLSLLVSQDTIDYQTKFITDGDYKAGRIVGENPDLPKYGLYPEVIGTDISNLTSGTTDMTSVAFTTGGLFGWRYVTPQQRTVGSAADFGSILIDILYKLINKNIKVDEQKITDIPQKNCNYIFSKIINYYEPLVTSNVIGELSKINEDVGIDPNDRNPLVLGIKKGEYRQPDIYALWCVHRSIRTPFYNRDVIKPDSIDISTDISEFFEFNVIKEGNNIEFVPKITSLDRTEGDSSNKSPARIKKIKDEVIKVLETGNGDKKIPALSIQVGDLVTEYNVTSTANTSLANKSIEVDIVKKLKNLSDTDWFNIITQSFTVLYLNLFLSSSIDWDKLTEKAGVTSSNVIPSKLQYKVENTVVTFDGARYRNLVKIANKQFNKYRNTIKSYFGTTSQNPMGGTSLIGSNPISIQRYGTMISYPGDTNILESISGYMTMLLSDINSVEKRLQEALNNMSNKYWYRDVLKWLELLFTIFKPNEVPPGISSSSSEVKSKFFQLEKILKNLYSKQLKIMMDSIQKSKILQKRYETSGKINKSLEKQIKLTSYSTNSTICYIKRQIKIIDHLLQKSLESWWTMSPSASNRKKRPVAPAFLDSDFSPAYRIMKSSLFEWFRGEVSRLSSTVSDPDILKEIRKLVQDTCESDKGNRSSQTIFTNVYLKDEALTDISTDARFWLLLIANLKNKSISNIGSNPEELQRLYIPVYENSGSSKKYYLFDIMPLVLKGNYKSQFGGMSSPQWMNATDLQNKVFTKNNSGIIVLANTPNEVAYTKNWKAISVEWLNNLVSLSEKSAYKQSNPSKKLWLIRTGIFLLLNKQVMYNSPAVKKEIFGDNDIDTTRNGTSKIISVLQKYQDYTNINKKTNNKYIMFVSREYIKNEMNSSSVQFQTT
jgi:hypothetical protein